MDRLKVNFYNKRSTMTYTTYKTTTQNPPVSISEPVWKDPVSGHDYKHDPERDNHLFDSHKAYHAKDDVKALRNILHQLKELGGDYGFNPDFKTNPQGKMRCTMNSGRKRKTDKKLFHHDTMTGTLILILNTLQKINQTRMSSGPGAVRKSVLIRASSNITKKPLAPSWNRQIRITSKAATRNV